MRHAEVNLLLAMAARGIHRIPRGTVLYTSLKPCRMCASLILAMQEAPTSLRVIALEDDPGPHGRHNILPGLVIGDDSYSASGGEKASSSDISGSSP